MANGSGSNLGFEERLWSAADKLGGTYPQPRIFITHTLYEKDFIEFFLSQHITSGVDELAVEKLPELLKIKYFTLPDAIRMLGDVKVIRELFIGFQMELYGVGMG